MPFSSMCVCIQAVFPGDVAPHLRAIAITQHMTMSAFSAHRLLAAVVVAVIVGVERLPQARLIEKNFNTNDEGETDSDDFNAGQVRKSAYWQRGHYMTHCHGEREKSVGARLKVALGRCSWRHG